MGARNGRTTRLGADQVTPVVVATLLLLAGCATAPEPTGFGFVVDEDGRPVRGAQLHTAVSVISTNERGWFSLPSHCTHGCELVIQAPGFEPLRLESMTVEAEGVLALRLTSGTWLIREAIRSLGQDRYRDTEAFAIRAMQVEPADPRAWILLALSQVMQGDSAAALTTLKEVEAQGAEAEAVQRLQLYLASGGQSAADE